MANTKHNKFELPEVKLVFATVPSETTRDVSLVIPVGNIWHIRRGTEGILLVDRTKPRRKRDKYLLSTLQDEAISQDTAFKIDSREREFIVQYTRGRFEYAHDGSDYIQLPYASQFMERGLHRFRCGSLEFSLELQEVSVPTQLELFT